MATAAPRKPSALWLVLEWVPRLLVATLFAYTGLTKIQRLDVFIKEVRAYQLIPVVWSNSLAYVLPWLEILAAVLLFVGLWRREARLLLVVMLLAFTGAKGYTLGIGRNIDCGCVPTASMLHFLFKGWAGVGTNVGLLLLLFIEALAERRRKLRRTGTTADVREGPGVLRSSIGSATGSCANPE